MTQGNHDNGSNEERARPGWVDEVDMPRASYGGNLHVDVMDKSYGFSKA